MASLTPGGEGRVLIGGGHTCPGVRELKTKEAVLEEGLLGLQQGTLTGEEQMGAEGGTDLG